jgi:cysteinyl-tRNA synthetase
MSVAADMAELAPGIDLLIAERARLRAEQRWPEADSLRVQLEAVRVAAENAPFSYRVAVDDAREGGSWHWTVA